jgi:hypothetical protein
VETERLRCSNVASAEISNCDAPKDQVSTSAKTTTCQGEYDLLSAKLKTVTPARRMYQQGEEILRKDINSVYKKTISVKKRTSWKGYQEKRRL